MDNPIRIDGPELRFRQVQAEISLEVTHDGGSIRVQLELNHHDADNFMEFVEAAFPHPEEHEGWSEEDIAARISGVLTWPQERLKRTREAQCAIEAVEQERDQAGAEAARKRGYGSLEEVPSGEFGDALDEVEEKANALGRRNAIVDEFCGVEPKEPYIFVQELSDSGFAASYAGVVIESATRQRAIDRLTAWLTKQGIEAPTKQVDSR